MTLGLSDDEYKILDAVFYQRDALRAAELEPQDGVPPPKLVHYTSAQTAMAILTARKEEDRCLWLRNATEMNDFSEVSFGQQMLIRSLKNRELNESFLQSIKDIHPDIVDNAFKLMGDEFETIRLNTYLLSLALHSGLELEIGQLSMWRAYGGDANVCLVFNTDAFVNDQDAYSVNIAPVDYRGVIGVSEEIARIRDALIEHRDALKKISPDTVAFNLKYALDIMLLSTKHPGFREENEWRIIYRPPPKPLVPDVPSKVVCVNGVVQTVFYLPMVDVPEKGITKANLNDLLSHIIIGPTPNADVVYNAFVRLLTEANVSDPGWRVRISGIPLRRA